MRIGFNPNKDKKLLTTTTTNHRVIIPVYIPNSEGYFKEAFDVFKICITSLLATINSDTAVSLISNGSSKEVNNYLKNLFDDGLVDRVAFNSKNEGKMNAIIAEARASFEEFITFSDADVFFDKGWLEMTYNMFAKSNKIGFVSMNPTPRNYLHSDSTLLANFYSILFTKKITSSICDFKDLEHFHKSIGKDESYTNNMYEHPVYTFSDENYILGAGHFCCTIRKTPTLKYVPKSKSEHGVSGNSEAIYLDIPFNKTGLFRVSSPKAYVWHMGNVTELEWSNFKLEQLQNYKVKSISFGNLDKASKFNLINFVPYTFRLKLVTLIRKLKILK